MLLYSMTQLLSEAGFSAPDLHVLNPNEENYSALLFQPQGDIEADTKGVRHANATLAGKQFSTFLKIAAADMASLVVTPECSMPWHVLEDALEKGIIPAARAVWVLGCESITLEQLAEFQRRLSKTATVIYEQLAPQAGRFLDPVVYVFSTAGLKGTPAPAILVVVQFKTSTMGDKQHYETNNLQTGTRLYYFGNGTTQIRLATIICSDSFAFTDKHSTELYDRTLLIHIQLNKSPRQAQYRQYRDKFLQFKGDETEILCLNWARGVNDRTEGKCDCWGNISGSAWYLRPNEFNIDDTVLSANHRKGFYYTWLQDLRCHALFFCYAPAIYTITATKVAHCAVIASKSFRTGPVLTSARIWDNGTLRWIEAASMDDGFSAIARICGDACTDISTLASVNPFCAERALALCAGSVDVTDWYTVKKLDSCQIDKSEVVRRVTACQDTDPEAAQFRTRRLRNAHRVATALKTSPPAALSDLQAGFKFDWSAQSPHTNIVSQDAAKRRATAIYLGDEHTMESVEEIAAKAADHIGQWEKTADGIVEAKQRLAVWFRDGQGNDVQFGRHRYTGYDEPHTDSPVDIGRDE
jgi:hypothetical protein